MADYIPPDPAAQARVDADEQLDMQAAAVKRKKQNVLDKLFTKPGKYDDLARDEVRMGEDWQERLPISSFDKGAIRKTEEYQDAMKEHRRWMAHRALTALGAATGGRDVQAAMLEGMRLEPAYKTMTEEQFQERKAALLEQIGGIKTQLADYEHETIKQERELDFKRWSKKVGVESDLAQTRAQLAHDQKMEELGWAREDRERALYGDQRVIESVREEEMRAARGGGGSLTSEARAAADQLEAEYLQNPERMRALEASLPGGVALDDNDNLTRAAKDVIQAEAIQRVRSGGGQALVSEAIEARTQSLIAVGVPPEAAAKQAAMDQVMSEVGAESLAMVEGPDGKRVPAQQDVDYVTMLGVMHEKMAARGYEIQEGDPDYQDLLAAVGYQKERSEAELEAAETEAMAQASRAWVDTTTQEGVTLQQMAQAGVPQEVLRAYVEDSEARGEPVPGAAAIMSPRGEELAPAAADQMAMQAQYLGMPLSQRALMDEMVRLEEELSILMDERTRQLPRVQLARQQMLQDPNIKGYIEAKGYLDPEEGLDSFFKDVMASKRFERQQRAKESRDRALQSVRSIGKKAPAPGSVQE